MAAMVDLAHREAKKGEFALAGLGKLVKQKRKARIGRNPATGEAIKIPAKTVSEVPCSQGREGCRSRRQEVT
jgi:DNA-binding protein HU-beta